MLHEIITPENYKFFKGISAIDKITHRVRAEHWARILNEVGTAGCQRPLGVGQTGSLRNNSFTGSASCAGKLMWHSTIHLCLQLQRQENCLSFSSLYLSPRSNFLLCHQTHQPQHLPQVLGYSAVKTERIITVLKAEELSHIRSYIAEESTPI